LLELDGRPIDKQQLRARRAQLDELLIAGRDQSTTIASSALFENGQELLAACGRLGLEGVMAKDIESIYTPGTRSPSWLKITCRPADMFVIVGYRPGQGGRRRSLGALLLATRDSPGQPLRHAGRVGSGFSDVELNELGRRLRALKLADPAEAPAIEEMPSGRSAEGAVLVQPSLVCEVAFHEWTRAGELRQPSWQGLHERADPNSVVRTAITESEAE
jgi:bifunctional non-homologous end joining protein LigD